MPVLRTRIIFKYRTLLRVLSTLQEADKRQQNRRQHNKTQLMQLQTIQE